MSDEVVRGVLTDLERALANDWGPYQAIILAERHQVYGNHENQRRVIRAAVKRLREQGEQVCANRLGYWLAQDATEWAAYQEARKAEARFAFVRIRRNREAVQKARGGQMLLGFAE